MSAAFALLALFGAQPAHAWYHTFQVWDETDLPITWAHHQPDNGDPLVSSMDDEVVIDIVNRGFARWVEDMPCAGLGASHSSRTSPEAAPTWNDDANVVSFSNPDVDDGTLAYTTCQPGRTAFIRDGNSYSFIEECDITFNGKYSWISDEDIDAGRCSGQTSLLAVATHEIGHLWGMAHSCDDPSDDAVQYKPLNVDCDDEVADGSRLRDAIMFWSTGPCDKGPENGFTSDDVEGLYNLYGPTCQIEPVSTEFRGGTNPDDPFEVCFELSCTEELPDAVTWRFGDGESSEQFETLTRTIDGEEVEFTGACHTYTSKGQFSITAEMDGTSDECGAWSSEDIETALVTVCDAPEVAEGFGGLFTWSHVDGLVYQMVNQVDTSVYGCVDSIQWEVYKGGSISGDPVLEIGSWAPKIEFPGEGTYTVVLNVGGPGGVNAAELTIDVVDQKGEGTGCSAAGGAMSLFGLMVGFGAAVRRRRD